MRETEEQLLNWMTTLAISSMGGITYEALRDMPLDELQLVSERAGEILKKKS